jgi:pyruvate formate lyase activating enzyme
VSWYHDPLPTNCVADWVCAGGTGAGYPHVSYTKGPEFGYKNLAVFYKACNYDCLFCQNWHYRESVFNSERVSATHLAAQADERTSCICYFGGDPTPQLPHALYASRLARANTKNRILRICWETNGAMDPKLLEKMVALSLESGGCIKFDLKALSEDLHKSLCGVSNKRTLENFFRAAAMAKKRDDPPLIVASTLLVPGYIDEKEVAGIARFIASIDATIPYALLAFHPQFFMADLPPTSREHAQSCKEAAEHQGLKRVRVGNLHLLREQAY